MATPTDGEWMSAYEALHFLQQPPASAAKAICSRAHAGLIQARAKRFIRNGTASDDAEVPAEFWWANGGAALRQDWATGVSKHGSAETGAYRRMALSFCVQMLSN
jgi:hypothetical protein